MSVSVNRIAILKNDDRGHDHYIEPVPVVVSNLILVTISVQILLFLPIAFDPPRPVFPIASHMPVPILRFLRG